MTVKTVILGDGPDLEGAQAQLGSALPLSVVHVGPGPDLLGRLLEIRPDLVLFDTRLTELHAVIALMDAHPAALVIGFNPADQTATVLSGETYPVTSTRELGNLLALAYATLRDSQTENEISTTQLDTDQCRPDATKHP